MNIQVYTDGSCHTQHRVGGWAAIIFIGTDKVILTGKDTNTTHNRMELTAVLKAIEYIKAHHPHAGTVRIFSDSQYVTRLPERREKLTGKDFITKKGRDIQNADLVKELYNIADGITVEFIKVQAHLKKTATANYNIDADQLAGNMLKEALKEIAL